MTQRWPGRPLSWTVMMRPAGARGAAAGADAGWLTAIAAQVSDVRRALFHFDRAIAQLSFQCLGGFPADNAVRSLLFLSAMSAPRISPSLPLAQENHPPRRRPPGQAGQ